MSETVVVEKQSIPRAHREALLDAMMAEAKKDEDVWFSYADAPDAIHVLHTIENEGSSKTTRYVYPYQ